MKPFLRQTKLGHQGDFQCEGDLIFTDTFSKLFHFFLVKKRIYFIFRKAVIPIFVKTSKNVLALAITIL